MAELTINADVTMGGAGGSLLANRYRVVRQLGQGGMGSVWLAEDTKLDNFKVAIKMLPSILLSNKRAYNQIKSEALVSLKLAHSNIATVRAFEENNGNPFLVIDYIEGQTLDDYLAEKGKLTEEETIRLLKLVAAALDYAHTQGVVHRDVKPGNVMIRRDGVPFVLDFGIAREIQETMTRVTGKLSSGTLMYMSPEQLHGAAPKPVQDIYSFAAMAYECLTGRPPFSRGQIEYQIEHDAPTPLDGAISIASGVMAGLAKNPEERPSTCAGVLATEAKKTDTADSRRTLRHVLVVAEIAALAAIVGGVWMLLRPRVQGESGRAHPVASVERPASAMPLVKTQIVEKVVDRVVEKPSVKQIVEKVVERPVVTQVAEKDVEKPTQGGSQTNKAVVPARPSVLSDGTKSILAKLERKVTLQLYISESATNMPMALKAYAARVENLLVEYERTASGRVAVERIDPKPGSDIEKTALRQGVVSQTADLGQPLYLGVVAVCDANREALGVLSPRTESVLEYDVTRLVSRVARTEKPVIGLMTSLKDVLGVQRAKQEGQSSSKGWTAFAQLAKDYDVKSVATDVAEIDPAVRTLVVLHAKDLSDKTLFAIDQFILSGGKLIVCVDPFSIKDMIACRQQQKNPMMPPGDGPSTLGKLFDAWGVKFETEKIACNLAASTKLNNGQGGVDDNPAFLSLGNGNMDRSDILVQSLSLVMFPFAGSFDFDVKRGMGLKFEPVIMTSREKSCLVDKMSMIIGGGVKGVVPDNSARVLAARLSGTFKTAFPWGADGTDAATGTLAEGLGSVILFADSDFLADEFCVRMMKTPFGNIPKPINDNLTLFSNVIEQYAGDEELIGIRLRKDLVADEEPGGEQGNAAPPHESASDETTGPCDVVVLIDASGSVGSDRFKSLCRKVVEGLSRFGAGCRFNLLLFRNTSKTAFDSWREVNGDSLRDASAWLGRQAVHGRTDLMSALESMLKLEIDRNRRTYAVLLTDADDNLTESLQARADRFCRANAGRVRLYAYGIKSSCNQELLDALASENHGELIVDEGTRWNCGGSLPDLFDEIIANSNESAGPKTVAVAQTEDQGQKLGEEREFELVNGVKMKFCWCPAGSFMMGSPTSEENRGSDETQHKVTLTQGFWMGKYEVTQRQWEGVMGDNPSHFKGADRPVERVSWEDCQQFIQKVNAAGQVTVSLPTEAQWEYACRAGTTTPFNFGSSLNGDKANCDGEHPYGTTVKGRYQVETVPVGSYAPNAWGLYDMHGNVCEWCADWYGDYPTGSVSDPTGPASWTYRVDRGGGWSDDALCCRSAIRGRFGPGFRYDDLGFRLVCSRP